MELKGYDPFPVDLNSARKLGDYTFYLTAIPVSWGRGHAMVLHIKDAVTGIHKEFNAPFGYRNASKDDSLVFFKQNQNYRKLYSVRGTLYAWHTGRARGPYQPHLPPPFWLTAKEPRLSAALKEDHRDWLKQRKNHTKKYAGGKSPTADLIYTEESIAAHIELSKLQAAVNTLLSNATDPTVAQVAEVRKAIAACQGRTGPLSLLGKHARSRK